MRKNLYESGTTSDIQPPPPGIGKHVIRIATGIESLQQAPILLLEDPDSRRMSKHSQDGHRPIQDQRVIGSQG